MFLPYVYIMRHRNTGHFYIGMRSANKVPAEADLGFIYFTSSKQVKSNFADYDSEIVAYFDSQLSAFEFENQLIKEHWGHPLLLNRHYQKLLSKFSMQGAKRPDVAVRNRQTKQKPKEGRTYTCANCSKDFTLLEFCHYPVKLKAFCSRSCAAKFNGRSSALSRKGQPNLGTRGQVAWNKGMQNPRSAKNGKAGAAKQSMKVLGRKIVFRNGKRTWAYPGDSDYPTTSVSKQVGTVSES